MFQRKYRENVDFRPWCALSSTRLGCSHYMDQPEWHELWNLPLEIDCASLFGVDRLECRLGERIGSLLHFGLLNQYSSGIGDIGHYYHTLPGTHLDRKWTVPRFSFLDPYHFPIQQLPHSRILVQCKVNLPNDQSLRFRLEESPTVCLLILLLLFSGLH